MTNFKAEYERKKQLKEPLFSFTKPVTSYMKVSEVLTYLKRNLGCVQYQLIEKGGKVIEGNFFKCEDIKKKMTVQEFRSMECEITQHLVNV